MELSALNPLQFCSDAASIAEDSPSYGPLRVTETKSGFWKLQREHVSGAWLDEGRAYTSRAGALLVARFEREKHGTLIVCPKCDSALGVDRAFSCTNNDCSYSVYDKPAPGKEVSAPWWFMAALVLCGLFYVALIATAVWG